MRNLWVIPFMLLLQGCPDEPVPPSDMPCENFGFVIHTGDSLCPVLIEIQGNILINPVGFAHKPGMLIPGEYIWFGYHIVSDSDLVCQQAEKAIIDCIEYYNCPSPVLIGSNSAPSNYPEDPFVLDSVFIENDRLLCIVSYSGGCYEHNFKLLYRENNIDNQPDINAFISHNGNGDLCEAWITDTLCFNIVTFQVEPSGETEITISPNSLISSFSLVLSYNY
jgi:hypothetical protein